MVSNMYLIILVSILSYCISAVPVDECPQVNCYAPCNSGYRTDDNGCQTCACVDPCEYSPCEEGMTCETQTVVCVKAPCYPVYECKQPCPQVRCSRFCKSGFRKTFKGCPTCECVDPCEYSPCAKGELCKSQEVQCFVAPCYNIPKCVKVCPLRKCVPCKYGYKYDVNGCQTCQCLFPCKEVECPTEQVCTEVVSPCLVAPCPVSASCTNTTSV